jgi:uncharacterized protein (DUF697 family)
MKFWEVIKEVSAQTVRQEANRLFVLALAGEPDAVAVARAVALGEATPAEEAAAEPFLLGASPPYSDEVERRLRHADLLVSLPGGPGITDFRPADTMRVERPDELVQRALAHRRDLHVSLARRLPGFRNLAAERVIQDVSRINAEFAALSTVSTVIPFLAPLFPAMAGADILVLTKNQVLMMFRLAAIYGEDLELKARVREALPIIGGAFGWRTLARTAAGVLPGALGLPVKAGIAYSGTYAVGRAAQLVFDEGRRPTRQEMLRIYEDGGRLARETVTRLRERLDRKKADGEPDETEEPSEPRKALPEPHDLEDPARVEAPAEEKVE